MASPFSDNIVKMVPCVDTIMNDFRQWLTEGVRHLPINKDTADAMHRQLLGIIRQVVAAADYHQAVEAVARTRAFQDSFANLFLASNDGTEKSMFDKAVYAMAKKKWPWMGHAGLEERVGVYKSWFYDEAVAFYNVLVPYLRMPNAYSSEAGCFREFESNKKAWARKVREKSKEAFRAIASIDDYLPGHVDSGVSLPIHQPVNVEMAGFSVVVMDHDDSDPIRGRNEAQQIRTVRAGMELFRLRGKQSFPWLIERAVPIRLFMGIGSEECGAKYEGRVGGRSYIDMWIGLLSTPASVAAVVAHEMGHHYWRVVLDDKAKAAWTDMVAKPKVMVDPKDILSSIPPGERFLDRHLQKNDPLTSIRLASMYYDPAYRTHVSTRGEIEDLAADGVKLQLPKYPITGYAAKNQEEAFCEAVSTLVAYGPNYVHDHVLKWLRTATGGAARPST